MLGYLNKELQILPSNQQLQTLKMLQRAHALGVPKPPKLGEFYFNEKFLLTCSRTIPVHQVRFAQDRAFLGPYLALN